MIRIQHASAVTCALLFLGSAVQADPRPAGLNHGKHIGKLPEDVTLKDNSNAKVKLCAAINKLRAIGNAATTPAAGKTKYTNAANELDTMKKEGRIGIECAAEYKGTFAALTKGDRLSTKAGDRMNVDPGTLKDYSEADMAGVLLHELEHCCQPAGMSHARKEVCAYWTQYCFYRDAKAAGDTTVQGWIDSLELCFPGFNAFKATNPASGVYPEDNGGYTEDGKKKKLQGMACFAQEPAVCPTLAFDWDNVGATTTIHVTNRVTGEMTTINTGIDTVHGARGYIDFGGERVLIVAGESSGVGICRRYIDTNADDLVDQASGVTVVPASAGVAPLLDVQYRVVSDAARLYVLAKSGAACAIYRLVDNYADGLPDALGGAFASSSQFPELMSCLSLATEGGDGSAINLAATTRRFDESRAWDYYDYQYAVYADSDDDGDADSSTGLRSARDEVELVPVSTNNVANQQTHVIVNGRPSSSVSVHAFSVASGSFTELLGTGQIATSGEVNITLSRALVDADRLRLTDTSCGITSPDIEVESDFKPMILSGTNETGLAAGGETVTLTGELLPVGTGSKCWFGETEASVVSRSPSVWVVTVPSVSLPTGTFMVVPVKITQSGTDDAIGVGHLYVSSL